MSTNGSQGGRSIATGGLSFDGTPISIELNYETYRASGNGNHAINNYDFSGRLPIFVTDKGIILREIRTALAEGREVTAGNTEFSRLGPLVLGFSEQQSLVSVGRFGLSSALGLKRTGAETPAPSEGRNIPGPFHPL